MIVTSLARYFCVSILWVFMFFMTNCDYMQERGMPLLIISVGAIFALAGLVYLLPKYKLTLFVFILYMGGNLYCSPLFSKELEIFYANWGYSGEVQTIMLLNAMIVALILSAIDKLTENN